MIFWTLGDAAGAPPAQQPFQRRINPRPHRLLKVLRGLRIDFLVMAIGPCRAFLRGQSQDALHELAYFANIAGHMVASDEFTQQIDIKCAVGPQLLQCGLCGTPSALCVLLALFPVFQLGLKNLLQRRVVATQDGADLSKGEPGSLEHAKWC